MRQIKIVGACGGKVDGIENDGKVGGLEKMMVKQMTQKKMMAKQVAQKK